LCFNPSINDSHFHIFIWNLTYMCNLDLCHRDLNFAHDTLPYNGEYLCQVMLKSLYACRGFAPEKRFKWPLIVTLTFNPTTRFMCATQFLIVMNIFMTFY
jgi:hypothetical protein